MNATRAKIIDQFIELKKKEKPIADAIKDLKPLFYEAMKAFPEGLNIDGAIIFSRECRKYEYSAAIKKAEKKLEAMKKAFEAKNEPSETVISWSVKL